MRRHWRWLLAVLVVLVAALVGASYVVDEPLRARLEARMNASLSGYRVHLGRADFHPLGFGLDLLDIAVFQEGSREQSIAEVDKLAASVQWRALISGHLVADMLIDHPTLHLDLRQAEVEAKNPKPVKQRGWQEAVEAIYPLKINELRIEDGDITYIPDQPLAPVQLTHLNARAVNIRNVHSPDRTYPSDFQLLATLGKDTELRIDGAADFLAEPFAAMKVHADVSGLELADVSPVLHRYNITARKGVLSTSGEIEYGPKVASAHLERLTMTGAEVDYFHTAATAPVESERVEAGVKAARQQVTSPTADIRVDDITIKDSTLGYADRSTDPPYRVFIKTDTFTIHNFSNQIRERTADAKLRGAFMGNGPTTLDATFRPETNGPDFDLALRIQDTDMTTLNDLWRAYAGFDVARGDFSLFSQMTVRNRRIDGYVKPIFADLQVFSPEQEAQKSLAHKIYEGVIGGIAWVLENKSSGDIATRTTISGRLENPNTSTWQAVLGVVQNAFFKAILPGLERQRQAG